MALFAVGNKHIGAFGFMLGRFKGYYLKINELIAFVWHYLEEKIYTFFLCVWKSFKAKGSW